MLCDFNKVLVTTMPHMSDDGGQHGAFNTL